MVSEREVKEVLPKGITRCSNGRLQARYTFEGKRYSLYGYDAEELAERLTYEKRKRERENWNREEKRQQNQQLQSQQLQNQQQDGNTRYQEANRLSLTDWYEVWMCDYKLTTVKQGTVDSYSCMYHYYIEDQLGSKCLLDIRGEDIQRFYNYMSRQGYSKATVSLASVVLSAMFRQAVKNEMISKNPTDYATLPRIQKKKERAVLTEQQQEVLTELARESDIKGIVLLALGTGMRLGEITALEWTDIDFVKKELNVRGTLKQKRNDNTFYRDVPKTGSSLRTIPLFPEMMLLLKKEKQKQKEERIAAGEGWHPVAGLENLVFLRKDGTPVSGQFVRQQLARLVNQANGKVSSAKRRKGVTVPKQCRIPAITPHTLRHTFATRAIEKGIPPKVVQELLGHSSITMTLDLYTHVLPQTKAVEIRKIAKLFE